MPWIWVVMPHPPRYHRAMRGQRAYYVYIMTNRSGTLYVGVTNDIRRRVLEHRQGLVEGFTRKYRITRLVYCETFGSASQAIAAEKTIKGWRRQRKLDLIARDNPDLLDLAAEWYTAEGLSE